MTTTNGDGAPPWTHVPPGAVVHNLTERLAVMAQELAIKDAYIDQLHQALQDMAGAVGHSIHAKTS